MSPGTAASGRRRLPAETKRLRGNPGGRPIVDDQPIVSSGLPEMPGNLSARAKEIWTLIVDEVREHALLWRLDAVLLARFCFTVTLAERAEGDILKHGATVSEPVLDRHGALAGHRVKKNPAVGIVLECGKAMRSLAAELCLSPSSRTKLRIEPPKEPDEFDLYLAGKGKL